jgi:predicted RNA-binding Zn ribbon-like protein
VVREIQPARGYEPPGLLGGVLCLDFVNTVDPRFAEDRREYLVDYADLLAWGRHVGTVPEEDVAGLSAAAAERPAEAAAVHGEAVALREGLHALLTAVLEDEPYPAGELALLNRWLDGTLGLRRLQPDGPGPLRWGWAAALPRLDRPLWPVVLSAAELLSSDRLQRVHRCPGEDGRCGWLFLDASKAGRRQWCSMQGCGNRAKARRHYARTRAAR